MTANTPEARITHIEQAEGAACSCGWTSHTKAWRAHAARMRKRGNAVSGLGYVFESSAAEPIQHPYKPASENWAEVCALCGHPRSEHADGREELMKAIAKGSLAKPKWEPAPILPTEPIRSQETHEFEGLESDFFCRKIVGSTVGFMACMRPRDTPIHGLLPTEPEKAREAWLKELDVEIAKTAWEVSGQFCYTCREHGENSVTQIPHETRCVWWEVARAVVNYKRRLDAAFGPAQEEK